MRLSGPRSRRTATQKIEPETSAIVARKYDDITTNWNCRWALSLAHLMLNVVEGRPVGSQSTTESSVPTSQCQTRTTHTPEPVLWHQYLNHTNISEQLIIPWGSSFSLLPSAQTHPVTNFASSYFRILFNNFLPSASKPCKFLFDERNVIPRVRFEVFTAVPMKNVVFSDIKAQFVPERRHIMYPLQSPAS
jgi:hypothetical protein